MDLPNDSNFVICLGPIPEHFLKIKYDIIALCSSLSTFEQNFSAEKIVLACLFLHSLNIIQVFYRKIILRLISKRNT